MKVLVFDQQSDLSIEPESIKPVIREVLMREGRSTDEVAVYFVTSEEISRLHEEFFQDPSPTDCISFPMDEDLKATGYHILGEIFICPKTALDYVLTLSEEISENCYTELTLYLVHGILHLLKYDDVKEEDRKKMRAAEKEHMEHLLRKKLLLKSKLS